MQDKPRLGPRAINAYNRLSREVAALNYVTRVAKPSGPLSEITLRSLNKALHLANRLYRREPGISRFAMFDPRDSISMADFVIIVARLSAASIAFEERYAHLTEAGKALPGNGN
ncbi:hypothetical protein [Devosia ginsengisoli]|uniref:hypothetical protein n=1 Tax=Devosia ginsengisoli TaxID=400770 RepID=UPI0026F07C03|nr:hypothetical protein [Devosia ginsengisoli]MCR6672733.1 hypothetical protein [Devosia ginsengisoli]